MAEVIAIDYRKPMRFLIRGTKTDEWESVVDFQEYINAPDRDNAIRRATGIFSTNYNVTVRSIQEVPWDEGRGIAWRIGRKLGIIRPPRSK